MKKSRIPYLIVMASCLLLGALSGCSQAAPSGGSPTQTPAASPAAGVNSVQPTGTGLPPGGAPAPPPSRTPFAPAASPTPYHNVTAEDLRGVRLAFWHPWSSSQAALLANLANEFTGQNEWGITVEVSAHGNLDELEAAYQAALDPQTPGNHALPDVVVAMPYQIQAWNLSRPLAALDALIADPQWGLAQAEQAAVNPVFWEQQPPGAERLSVPAQRSARFLAYNQSWARQLGFDQPPRTADELQAQACAAVQANNRDDDPDNDASGGLSLSTDYTFLLGWIYAFGGDPQPAGQPGYQFDTPEVEQALRFLRGLFDAGCAQLADGRPGETAFAVRQALFTPASAATLAFIDETMQQAGSADAWTVIAFPGPQQQAVVAFGPDYAIPAEDPNRRLAAWLFVRWLLEPAQAARLGEAGDQFPLLTGAAAGPSSSTALPWPAAYQLLDDARPEPAQASWNLVRWALSDAGTQLFRYYFTIDQIPELLELLDETAADLAR